MLAFTKLCTWVTSPPTSVVEYQEVVRQRWKITSQCKCYKKAWLHCVLWQLNLYKNVISFVWKNHCNRKAWKICPFSWQSLLLGRLAHSPSLSAFSFFLILWLFYYSLPGFWLPSFESWFDYWQLQKIIPRRTFDINAAGIRSFSLIRKLLTPEMIPCLHVFQCSSSAEMLETTVIC